MILLDTDVMIDLLRGYIATLEEDGLPVPEERFETLVVAV